MGDPMTGARARTTITCGALIRRQVRAALEVRHVPYSEHKGWLDSVFVVDATLDDLIAVQAAIDPG